MIRSVSEVGLAEGRRTAKNMPLFKGPIVTRDTSLGVHVRALAELLAASIADESDGLPSERRVRLRGHLAALKRAYPQFLALNEVELAHDLEEADGVPIED